MENLNIDQKGNESKYSERRPQNVQSSERYPFNGYERERMLLIKAEKLKTAFEKELRLKGPGLNLASVVSHEVRNPLNVIITSLSIIESDLLKFSTGERVSRHLDKIKAMVDGMTQVLDDVLYLDQLDQGRFELNLVEFDLKEFIQNLICETDNLLKNGQYVTMTYSGEQNVIQDRKVLRYIIHNLISNAAKYSGQRSEIEIYCNVSERITMEVRDHGIGIPEQDQSQLFKPYFRAGNARRIKGIGLGLNIIKRFTELLSGNIRFSSRLHSGTSFVLTIPNYSIV